MEGIVMHKRMIALLHKHHLLSVATVVNDKPWCASCFYTWESQENWIIITTDEDTLHGSGFINKPDISGTIALETLRVGRIRGVQFTGKISLAEGEKLKKARKAYLLRFPYAIVASLHLWIIEPDYIKLTDNRLGFGTKIIWKKEESL
jgi:uncharacterized protein